MTCQSKIFTTWRAMKNVIHVIVWTPPKLLISENEAPLLQAEVMSNYFDKWQDIW